MTSKWAVHKFGGTSVADADRIKTVAKIVQSRSSPKKAVVVSAMSKVTDALIELVQLAKEQNDTYLQKLEILKKRHFDAVAALLPLPRQTEMFKILDSDFSDIAEVLRGVWLARTYSESILELISGQGEIWSAQFLNEYFKSLQIESTWLDARKVLIVEPQILSPIIDWKTSKSNLEAWLQNNPSPLLVITGFIASTAAGISTTLKRNGSDFSASIFGALLDASEIVIWTDVDGVMTADPRLVPEAVLVDELSYHEATELAYFGAKVLHPSTMAPAIRSGIPIWIKNTFNPTFIGTKISSKANSNVLIKGFSTIDRMVLVNLEGTGMIGVPGVAQRLFGALKEVNVSVVMISQASSEHSICFAVSESQAPLAKKTVEREFMSEITQGLIQSVTVTEKSSIIAIVGDGMAQTPGVAGRFFTALARAGVNIRAIAQGSSERNISAVIAQEDSRRALRAVHSAFYLSNQTISIGVIGPGLIGGTFLKQLQTQTEGLKKDRAIDLRVRGILNSKTMLLDDAGIALDTWKSALEKSSLKTDLNSFVEHVHANHLPHTVLIDATSSAEVIKHYPEWLKKGIHIITPNKKANTAAYSFYREIKDAARAHHCHYLYQTTVGAGLPIISTLRDFVQTGDRVLKIEGVFSGTLSYIFNSFNEKTPFSQIVKDAKAKGYTEPDPRDDLSGMDVARKLVILAREMGLPLELSEISVNSLVPNELQKGSIDEYLNALPDFDSEMAKLYSNAESQNSVLRYVGTIDPNGQSRVELKAFPKNHAFAKITGSDNIVAFRTSRYDSQPLVIQGPGAGPEVTAGGVFADLLRLASYLGAPL